MRIEINRRQVLSCLTAAAALPFADGLANAAQHQTTSKPNIVLLLADDMHFRALGCQGNNQVYTPNIDQLAKDGMRFTHCHVSNPICTPSRAALLTGQYGFQNGVTFFGHRLNNNSPRMPALLKEQGYQTAFTGKWHNNGRPLEHGFTQMKHTFLGGMHGYDSIPVVNGLHDSPYEIKRYPTEVFTESTLELLHNAANPYFLMYSLTAPHDPRSAPPEYEAMYDADAISLPENFMRNPTFDPGTLEIRDEKLLRRPLNPNELKREIAKYYAMITHLDHQIGLILEFLKRTGQMDSTYIVFAADNGLALGSHGLLGKQTMYEEGIRVPLIVKGPGITAGSECGALVDLMDLSATFVELSGGTPTETMRAKSLVPLLMKRDDAPERETIFSHYDERGGNDDAIHLFRMVKDKRYKLIRYLKQGKDELFDLQNDPYELKDLATSPEHQEVKAGLSSRLQEWQKEMNDDAAAG